MNRSLLTVTLVLGSLLGVSAQEQQTSSESDAFNAFKTRLVGQLKTLGYLSGAESATPKGEASAINQAMETYAKRWTNGQVTEVPVHLSTRGCMVSDNFASDEANIPPTCREAYGIKIGWSKFNATTIGFTQARALDLFEQALDEYNSRFDINISIVSSLSTDYNCAVGWEGLTGNTLAWSNLANNSCQLQQQRYDIRPWGEHLFFQTVIHEIGHLIGLHHRNGNYVMNPTIKPQLDGLTEQDIKDVIALGYSRKGDPDPDPDGYSFEKYEDGEHTVTITVKDGLVVKVVEAEVNALIVDFPKPE